VRATGASSVVLAFDDYSTTYVVEIVRQIR